MSFKVISPGTLSQIQDLGRYGELSNGISHSGAMDELAFRWNNALLNNDDTCAQIEIAIGGLSLQAQKDCIIAISGAYMACLCNGEPLINWCSHHIKKGDRLTFSHANQHVFCYLAVSGGFQSPALFNSRSTITRLKLGGINGRALAKDDVIALGKNKSSQAHISFNRALIPNYKPEQMGVIASYQFDGFSKKVIDLFSSQAYTVSRSDRMGSLLQADKTLSYKGGELASEGTVMGSIQITNSGQPIVLQRDAQSIGGYPKIGVVCRFDLNRLAQKTLNQKVTFKFIEKSEAIQKSNDFIASLQSQRKQIYGH